MASLEKSDDAQCSMHGVAHLMTVEQLLLLDAIESGYNRHACACVCYDECTTIAATGYVMKEALLDRR